MAIERDPPSHSQTGDVFWCRSASDAFWMGVVDAILECVGGPAGEKIDGRNVTRDEAYAAGRREVMRAAPCAAVARAAALKEGFSSGFAAGDKQGYADGVRASRQRFGVRLVSGGAPGQGRRR